MGRLGVEDRPGGLRVLTLDNPAKRNAIDEAMLEAVARALVPAPDVRCLLVRAAGERAFSSGYDLSSAPALEPDRLPDDRLLEVFRSLEQHPVPTVALVTGPAFGGGCDLAAACDFRVGSPDALFCMPPARLGLVYAPDGLARFCALVGAARAKRMFFTAKQVDAETAHRWGLLDLLEPTAADAEKAALGLCDELSSMAPLSLAGMKRTFAALTGPRSIPSGEERAALEALRRQAFSSADAAEGLAAFLEKRRPVFRGE